MIKMQVIGRLGKDGLVNTVSGRSVINFSVAHSERFKDSTGNLQEKTVWVDCAYWTDRTAIAPYLVKGVQVFVEGTPEVRTFSRQDGTTGASLSLRVREVQLLGSKNDAPGAGTYTQQPQQQAASTAQQIPPAQDYADDLPF